MGVLVFDLGRDVAGHTRHAVAAERLDAGALHGFEDRARLTGTRHQFVVQLVVVARDRQRQTVCPAAHDRDFVFRWDTRWFGQMYDLAVGLRPPGCVSDLDLVISGNGRAR